MLTQSDLNELQKVLSGYARDFGLDFGDVRFEMLDFRTLNQVAAYDGFPNRYPHWRFGMEYEHLSKSYAYGLHRIYELVINTDPCYAYLLSSNERIDQKLVIAHVYGHADFFRSNLWYAHTNRKMLDEMSNHAARMRRHMERYGLETVENFLDACLSLDNLIDIHAAGVHRRPAPVAATEPEAPPTVSRMPAKDYMDSFINPPEFIEEQQRRMAEEEEQSRRFPAQPERDVLLFLLENAPLQNWQHDVLDIVREEAYYFAPQRQTKIMNEGWASFAHTHIMTERALEPNEVIDYAEHHSGTVAVQPGRLNPYKLGLELYRDIEDRWNRGAFGPKYEACADYDARRQWDKKLGQGRQKVFEVRRIYNDIGFIDEFLTEDFARQQRLFTFAVSEPDGDIEITSRDFNEIKQKLLFQLTNFGQPLIEVVDANYQNRGELYLMHHHEGIDLDIPFAQATLQNLHTLWGRPVHIETFVEGQGKQIFSHDGQTATQKKIF